VIADSGGVVGVSWSYCSPGKEILPPEYLSKALRGP